MPDDDFVETVGAAVAAMDKAIARIDQLESALRQIAEMQIDISFMADHLIWAKGLARTTLYGEGT